MKILFRILIVLCAVVIIYYYSSDAEKQYEPLEGPNSSQIIPKTDTPETIGDALPRPEKGLSTLIDLESEQVLERFGEPNRIDKTSFGYNWWVYNREPTTFVMFGIKNDIVTQVYISGEELDASPYKIGQTVDEVYRMTIIETEVAVQMGDNLYTFAMNEQDMGNRLLTQFDGIYAQLYIDEVNGVLNGIRYTNGETLVEHRPYEMSFMGKLHTPPNPNSYLVEESNVGNANQLVDLINIFRDQNERSAIQKEDSLSTVAMNHSKDMYTDNYLSHNSPTFGTLKQRLEIAAIEYEEVTENLAKSYFDAIEAAHGWINSENHREVLLDESFTHVGSGAFFNYYTQIFISKTDREE